MNRHSPFTFFGLLMIPFVFGVVHAQDNASNSANSKDPFELMLNQAREEQRQKMLQDFTQSEKENEMQNMNKAKPSDQQNPGANPNQPNKTAPNPVAPHVAPGSSIPLPGTSPTNSNEPAAPPANIYLPPPPPPGVVPPGQGSSQPPLPPAPSAANSALLPPAAPPNVYG